MGFIAPKLILPPEQRAYRKRITKDEHPMQEEWSKIVLEPPSGGSVIAPPEDYPPGQSNRALLALMKRLEREIAEREEQG